MPRLAALLVMLAVLLPTPLGAQEEPEPTATAEPTIVTEGVEDSAQRQTSDTRVRYAVGGLITIAAVTFVSTLLYWRHTGRLARERFEAKSNGHAARALDADPEIYLEHLFDLGQRDVAAQRRSRARRSRRYSA